MARVLLSLLLLSLVFPVYATDFTQDANCERAYLFTEGSGTTVDNAEGTAARDGTFKGSGEPAWTSDVPAGYSNYSVDYDDNDDFISSVDPSLTDSMTIMSWAKSDDADFGSSHVNSFHPGFFLTSDGSTNMRFAVATPGENSVVLDSYSNLGLTWHHYVGVYDDGVTADDIITYVDGVEKNTASESGNIDTGGDYNLGSYWGSHTSTFCWDGHIAESAIFSRNLTLTEINEIFDNSLDGSLAVTAKGQVIIIYD